MKGGLVLMAGLISVIVEHIAVKAKADSKPHVKEAKKNPEYLGNRVLETGRGTQKKFILQVFYKDPGGSPETGKARLFLPEETLHAYGVSAA